MNIKVEQQKKHEYKITQNFIHDHYRLVLLRLRFRPTTYIKLNNNQVRLD